MSDPRTITRLLHQCRGGDGSLEAFESLMPLVYDDLKRLARQQLARLRPGQTLNTTALAHESYLKLQNHADLDWADRRHFFAIAARAMRQILVDYARRRWAAKRPGLKVDLDLERVAKDDDERTEQMLHVDQLLERLASVNVELVRVVECRYFAGYTQDETASVLGVSTRTIQRRWKMARAWLRELALETELH